MAEQAQTNALPDGAISEWRASRATKWAWMILIVPIFLIALDVYATIAAHGTGEFRGTFNAFGFAIVAALAIGLLCVHEAIHGVVMVAFGSRPTFGVLKNDGFPIGLYATSPGHRFSKSQYLIVALAPLAILGPIGILACWLPNGGYLVVPFAAHLAGCIGDLTIVWHVLRAPAGVACEDMQDGTRFWSAQV
jgi:hypothetical protein